MRSPGSVLTLSLSVAASVLWISGAAADPKPQKAGSEETMDQIMEKAAGDEPVKPAKVDEAPAAKEKADDKPAAKVASAPAKVAKTPKPVEAPAPVTDDNDTTEEAVRPAALEAVRPVAQPRNPGAYEMGALDCRMLDGAGIERILPKKMMAGEEPDLLCRVIITQPATVATASHTLTLAVTVGAKATYQQVRSVRVSTIGRRSLVFIVPADRISSEDAARVTLRATLSGLAKPPMREVKFVVEPAD
ncbi:MAG: hypothetical protein EXR72_12605 [Myxococcales bacterium]|nr:hypothetical protein [Myxococcales bacterium]